MLQLKPRCRGSPFVLVIFVPKGVIDGVAHHLLLHVHNLTLPLKFHHDLLNLRQFELWRNTQICTAVNLVLLMKGAKMVLKNKQIASYSPTP